MSWPGVSTDEVAWIGAEQMREIDRQMIDVVGVTLLQMMENAGRSLAAVVRAELDPAAVLVLAGSGGNGGGGLVAARHLVNAGVGVRAAVTTDRYPLSDTAAHQLAIVERMGVEVSTFDSGCVVDAGEVVVDAMVGYSLRGELSGRAAAAAELLDGGGAAGVVSLDVPSGLSADDGATGRAVAADMTVMLCLPKIGLARQRETGRLFLADISVPANVVDAVTGGPAPPFDRGPILEVR